jgi:hypothetical protein
MAFAEQECRLALGKLMQDLQKIYAEAEQHPRLLLDLEIRHKIFGGERNIEIPRGTQAFWSWHSSFSSPHDNLYFVEIEGAPAYPTPHRGRALWFSGGVESTYTKHKLAAPEVEELKIEDFAVFQGRHRKVGQIHFICAALSAAMGYETAYLGIERHDLLIPKVGSGRRYVERSTSFLDAWNRYLADTRIDSLCSSLSKEEILERVLDNHLSITGTCDTHKDGRWCGDCFKCYEAYYTAKAIGRNLGFKLRPAAFDRYFSEYARYLESNFSDNYNNAQQYFARLRIMYDVTFDKSADCFAAN